MREFWSGHDGEPISPSPTAPAARQSVPSNDSLVKRTDSSAYVGIDAAGMEAARGDGAPGRTADAFALGENIDAAKSMTAPYSIM
jgi:hypothetical protein